MIFKSVSILVGLFLGGGKKQTKKKTKTVDGMATVTVLYPRSLRSKLSPLCGTCNSRPLGMIVAILNRAR